MPLSRPHRVAVIAVPPVTTFDLSIPEVVFGATDVGEEPAYEVTVCAPVPGVVKAAIGIDIVVTHGLEAVERADTVMVTGTGSRISADPRVLDALRKAAAEGRRITSICTGAFVLAQAGLLDARRATTFWTMSEEFRRLFPEVDLVPGVLFVEDGRVLTSAGLSAGIDLCLHMVRCDYGSAVANATARLVVAAPVRPGGQAQFIETPLPPERGTALAATRAWALARLDEPTTLAELARHAGLSVRTLTRRFRSETGLSPLQWLLHQRLDRAREILETTTLPMDQVAARSGLGTADSLRTHLLRRTGLTPTAYRAAAVSARD
ncbi:helix-turn-helix domain-containing protein [Streptomyces sp. NBC_00249]|uniref:GlxA family transcriptional regulator n=1 Tax=Streptomyces sp. NBC_00249 TaxID=2975690 RepID=UPI002253B574|nr:helix-turn-helix domain-containing protein [Streptomyces sp. NBC_00249]MCX5196722.1 helix-turn-helix domain-containing protein [Streptomyces sp. NBC_00249]